jgi:periplasmic protein CpxP/Spy
MHKVTAATVLVAALAATGMYTVTQDISAQDAPQGRRGGGPGRGGPGGPGGPGAPVGPEGRGRGGPRGGILGPIPLERLNLTEAQHEQVRTIAEGGQEAQRALHDRAFATRGALEAAIMADTVDEAAIRARSAEVAAIEADVAVSRAKLRNQVFQILTPEQRAEANRFQAEASGRGRRGQAPRF